MKENHLDIKCNCGCGQKTRFLLLQSATNTILDEMKKYGNNT